VVAITERHKESDTEQIYASQQIILHEVSQNAEEGNASSMQHRQHRNNIQDFRALST
jgi:hypothetical protein